MSIQMKFKKKFRYQLKMIELHLSVLMHLILVGPKTKVLDVKNKHVCPSFVDPHIHIDHFLTPAEFVKKSLLCGVTSLFPDSIDIVSVCGYRGFKEFLRQTENLQ